MTEQLPFNGIMNLDDNNNVFPPACHKQARNIIFKGNPGNYRAENVPGTRSIPYDLPEGHNECIGSFYDPLKQRTFWFNYNSNRNHGIYQLHFNTVTPVTVCDDIDYLNFSFETIHSINILYGDSDILLFLDCLKRPTKINIDRAISGGYGVMQRSFLDVAKEPPLLPPTVAYDDDPTAKVNNLRKVLFQFRYRWIFDDKEKSAWSTISEMPVPANYSDPLNDSNPTKNALIHIGLLTGDRNVTKIELAGRQNVGGDYGDFFHITTIDKASGIIDNTTYNYTFLNNNAASYVSVPESLLLFDYVPKEANAQELLNGNIIIYGGIKEGYNLDVVASVSVVVDVLATSTILP